jgi:hypothetical protein
LRGEKYITARLEIVNTGNGEEGNRTPDLLLAKQALYQLSYFPACKFLDREAASGFSLSARTWIRTKDLSFIRAAL